MKLAIPTIISMDNSDFNKTRHSSNSGRVSSEDLLLSFIQVKVIRIMIHLSMCRTVNASWMGNRLIRINSSTIITTLHNNNSNNNNSRVITSNPNRDRINLCSKMEGTLKLILLAIPSSTKLNHISIKDSRYSMKRNLHKNRQYKLTATLTGTSRAWI